MADLLWAEPVGGMAGDMFLAAALDAGVPEAELTRALATIPLEGWRLEVTEVQSGGMSHDLYAYVARVFVCQQRVKIVDDSCQDAAARGQGKFSSDQPPQHSRNRLMVSNHAHNVVDDELADRQQPNRQQGGDNPEDDAEKYDRRSGLPHNIEYRRELA